MINKKYLDMFNLIENPKLIFIGKDPYPSLDKSKKENIPFFKQTKKEFEKDNCSGKQLFKGLGIELPKNEADWNEGFYINTLVDNRIILLNASYEFISCKNLSLQRKREKVNKYWKEVNNEIISNHKCKILIVLSAYKLIKNQLECYKDRLIIVPHPDYRNSWNKHKFKFDNIDQFSIKRLWEKYYKNKGGLLKIKSLIKYKSTK